MGQDLFIIIQCNCTSLLKKQTTKKQTFISKFKKCQLADQYNNHL